MRLRMICVTILMSHRNLKTFSGIGQVLNALSEVFFLEFAL